MALYWTPWTLAWSGIAIVTCIVLFFRVAPYGRHATDSFGPTLPHRVGWIIMELVSPCTLVLMAWVTLGGSITLLSVGQLLLFALWIGHYLYRALWYPYLARWKNRRMPIAIMVSAIVFNTINGSLNGFELALRPPLELNTPSVWVGAVLFGSGLALNVHSDAILRRLRKPGESGYSIPQNGLFRWVSCPNYLGEILEWIGFAIMAATPAAWTFALWTAANLIPRAVSHHRWYRETFDMYPARRKAVLPFIL